MQISNFSIKRPVFTTVLMFLVLILGAVSLMRIPLKLIPDLNPPVAVVVTSYEGASPVEVIEKVTKPLEESLATLPGIKNISSTSQEGSNFILLEFSWSTGIDDVQSDVLQRIDQTPLPDDAGKPRFMKFDPAQFPVIQLSLQSEAGEKELQKLAEQLEQELATVEGVASVSVSGTLEEEIVIELDEGKLEEYNLAQSDIVQLIQANNISLPGSPVESEGQSLTTRIISELTSVEDIQSLVLTVNPLNGEEITIGDIASVSSQPVDTGTITRANGQPGVLLSVLQQSDANTAEVSEQFQERLNELLSEDQYKDIRADVLFDQGDYVQLAIGNIGNSLIIGGILAMLVLFVFLRNVRSPLIVGVAIPYSVIVTFVLMYFADFDLNLMTLGALALGIGMLVDNSIVVLENIYRHLSMGKDSRQAARDGAKEVGGAITASTLTTIAVFLPVIFISGILGQIFKEFALTISFSLAASLVVALTVIPMMASRWLKRPVHSEEKRKESGVLRRYDRAIRWALRHRLTVIGFSLLLLIGGLFGLTTVGTQFLPATDEGFFSVGVELEHGASLESTDEVIQAIEERLSKEDDVSVYVSLVGSTQESSARGGGGPSNEGELYVKLTPLEERERSMFAFVDDIQGDIKEAAKRVDKSAEVEINMQSASGTTPQTLSFNVRSSDSKELDQAVSRIEKAVADIKGVKEVSTDREETVDEIQITVDREKALEAGLAPAQIAASVNDATRGVPAAQITTEGSEVETVIVRYSEEATGSVEGLKGLLIKTPSGVFYELNELADITVEEGPVSVQRINQEEAVQFTVQYTAATNLGEVSQQVDEQIASLQLDDRVTVSFSGERELLDSSIDDMVLALILAIVLIYIVMAAQYESFKYPFVIMFTVPLAVVGVAIALIVTRLPLSIPAIIGVLILIGIVVNNAIVIVDYILQRKRGGLGSYEAIIESSKDRIRPILMTALTTILGLVPLALGLGSGTEINQPMGIAVIGGLISSTLLTLFVIPVVYSFFDKDTRKMNKKAVKG
ncbi:efflux RND transporter permease subunit [Bacillus thermotolerans]|uniref:RND multidrug efflux transporter n=1 Tax=Bacillus thermotolerans TaxID=1221996 RepID=A0A0F5I1K8_BACTR|nr:efflux RND transporter permease subunit [Bacillus thermotolerans]KKB39155.1 RND multidrug efflux transporter [Bacillus thermotolerans]KKB42775.1 RND multidrug efflux transporter [Bacillus thermotolerans]